MGNTMRGTSKTTTETALEFTTTQTQISTMVNGRMISVLAADAFSQLGAASSMGCS